MPMGMKSSGFERQAELKENYVTSYLQKGKQLIPYKPNFQLFYPAGAMSSTAADMGHYISMLLLPVVISLICLYNDSSVLIPHAQL